jgi:hypothetical protein
MCDVFLFNYIQTLWHLTLASFRNLILYRDVQCIQEDYVLESYFRACHNAERKNPCIANPSPDNSIKACAQYYAQPSVPHSCLKANSCYRTPYT